ncbi:MAG TPA: hypothetical protein VEQ85_11765 [Lacipirellulaceae bacterium]|nr:hypothetical protein [Lacipirellulaceae bacterium]
MKVRNRRLGRRATPRKGRLILPLVSGSAPKHRPMTEEEYARLLATKGVVSPPHLAADDDDEAWDPIEVDGQPLSEMIIEERG